MKAATMDSIQAYIEKEIRPAIREDGGELEFVGIAGDVVHVRMAGACATCPSRLRTLRHFIEPQVRAQFGRRWSVTATFAKPYYTP